MDRTRAVAILEARVAACWALINQVKARKMAKANARVWTSAYKLEIEALKMAIEALKNPGYVTKGAKEHD